MNLFEIFKDAAAPFIDGKKRPLNTGEVMNLWFYLIGTNQTLRIDQVALNTTQDPELKAKLEEIIQEVHNPMIVELTDFFKKEGIPLPNTTPEKPMAHDLKDIPPDALISDEEIANLLVYNLYIGINSAVRGLTEAVRADVGMMFAKYEMMKLTYFITLKDLMKRRGWLHIPPYYRAE
ncbi:DUF3231 family protein [Ammoniphilus sp. CFH 90114]|uniref:DUF3231 family protein n=1 Tax=Ammoniphilus sp. CFH 90114 TaxID=2493665 RepID=UPI00100E6AF9|nr:DUF3231 family protein [Ammoniphilus sp. CFH 90114]RXT07793.1 DUF3231 family protein [Ammoniphilus sp. CFH 90114]